MSGTRPGPETDSWAAAIGAAAQSLVLTWLRGEASVADRVSPSQLRALTVIDRHGPLNLNTLAGELGAIPSSASRLCHRLLAAGLLTRDVSETNRRFVTFALSDDGQDLLRRLEHARKAALGEVLERLAPGVRSALLNSLRDFAVAAAGPSEQDSASSTG